MFDDIPVSEPTNLREVEARAQIERSVRAEFAEQEKTALERDDALRALTISVLVGAGLMVPFAALVLGLSWRLLRWSAGYGW